MNRRNFFALLLAPFLERFLPKAKSVLDEVDPQRITITSCFWQGPDGVYEFRVGDPLGSRWSKVPVLLNAYYTTERRMKILGL